MTTALGDYVSVPPKTTQVRAAPRVMTLMRGFIVELLYEANAPRNRPPRSGATRAPASAAGGWSG